MLLITLFNDFAGNDRSFPAKSTFIYFYIETKGVNDKVMLLITLFNDFAGNDQDPVVPASRVAGNDRSFPAKSTLI